jgi:hypothetical protein
MPRPQRDRAAGGLSQGGDRPGVHDVDRIGGRGALLRLDRWRAQAPGRPRLCDPLHPEAARIDLERGEYCEGGKPARRGPNDAGRRAGVFTSLGSQVGYLCPRATSARQTHIGRASTFQTPAKRLEVFRSQPAGLSKICPALGHGCQEGRNKSCEVVKVDCGLCCWETALIICASCRGRVEPMFLKSSS